MTDRTDEPHGDELAELRALARTVRPHDVEWEAPPADLWDRIAAEADLTTPYASPALARAEPARDDTVVPFARQLRRNTRWLLAAAAIVLIALVGGLAIALSTSDDDGQVVASAPLSRLGASGDGYARLVDRGGALRIELETSGLEADDGFFEVWVIDPEVSKLVSLGPLRDDGVYELPAGIDPTAFPIVDVSVEPIDGDPAHSGNSVLRGQLQF